MAAPSTKGSFHYKETLILFLPLTNPLPLWTTQFQSIEFLVRILDEWSTFGDTREHMGPLLARRFVACSSFGKITVMELLEPGGEKAKKTLILVAPEVNPSRWWQVRATSRYVRGVHFTVIALQIVGSSWSFVDLKFDFCRLENLSG